MAVFFGWILWTEAPRLHKQGLARAWEGNQQGYALLTAIRETAKTSQLTAYWYGGHTFATLYFKTNGVYLNEYPDLSPTELVNLMREHKVQHIVQSGDDERLLSIIALLNEDRIIKSTTIHRSVVWADTSREEVPVHYLEW